MSIISIKFLQVNESGYFPGIETDINSSLARNQHKWINGLFQCGDCEFGISDQDVFLSHLKEKHKIKKCFYCNEEYEDGQKLVRHILDSHNKNEGLGIWRCIIDGCDYFSRQISDLSKHIENHGIIKEFICHICKEVKDKELDLIEHMKLRIMYNCSKCQFSGDKKETVENHIKIHSGKVDIIDNYLQCETEWKKAEMNSSINQIGRKKVEISKTLSQNVSVDIPTDNHKTKDNNENTVLHNSDNDLCLDDEIDIPKENKNSKNHECIANNKPSGLEMETNIEMIEKANDNISVKEKPVETLPEKTAGINRDSICKNISSDDTEKNDVERETGNKDNITSVKENEKESTKEKEQVCVAERENDCETIQKKDNDNSMLNKHMDKTDVLLTGTELQNDAKGTEINESYADQSCKKIIVIPTSQSVYTEAFESLKREKPAETHFYMYAGQVLKLDKFNICFKQNIPSFPQRKKGLNCKFCNANLKICLNSILLHCVKYEFRKLQKQSLLLFQCSKANCLYLNFDISQIFHHNRIHHAIGNLASPLLISLQNNASNENVEKATKLVDDSNLKAQSSTIKKEIKKSPSSLMKMSQLEFKKEMSVNSLIFCEHCEKSMNMSEENALYSMRRHVIHQHMSKPFYCSKMGCDFSADNYSQIENHLSKSHPYWTLNNMQKSYVAEEEIESSNQKVIQLSLKSLKNKRAMHGGESLAKRQKLKRIIEEDEDDEDEYRCTICFAKLPDVTRIESHLKSHFIFNRYKCVFCSEKFTELCSISLLHAAYHESDLNSCFTEISNQKVNNVVRQFAEELEIFKGGSLAYPRCLLCKVSFPDGVKAAKIHLNSYHLPVPFVKLKRL